VSQKVDIKFFIKKKKKKKERQTERQRDRETEKRKNKGNLRLILILDDAKYYYLLVDSHNSCHWRSVEEVFIQEKNSVHY
jgi:hypothetical protein